MYDAAEDPYTYSGSTILVNRLDLRDRQELSDYELEISSARSAEPLPAGALDFAHYRSIHRHLFQDVYDWAGKVRTVRLSKGGNPFCFPEHIEAQAAILFERLRGDGYLRNLNKSAFAQKAAHFLAELNVIHAFREGNGRSQLSFFVMLAAYAGHPLDMERMDSAAMLSAMIASFDGDERPLAEIIAGLDTV